MTAAHDRERGSALLAVLVVLLFLELAIVAAATQIRFLSRQLRVTSDRVAADRLADAGLAYAEALLAVDPTVRGGRMVELAQGDCIVYISGEPGDGPRVVSVGRARSLRAVELDVLLERRGSRLVQVRRSRRFFKWQGPVPLLSGL